MGVIPEVLEKVPCRGPWEGQTVCRSCRHELSGGTYADGEYYSNKSVCPYCGESNEGTDTVVRRKVFTEPERKQTWWEWLCGAPVKERPFTWEIKETDD